jgi:outer membrane protein assembly factor BamE (lipoprotein component of BamABCDE complex)
VKSKLLIVSILVFLSACAWFTLRPGRHFDRALWRNSATPASVRLRMADDLVNSQKLVGLTRQQVVELLGEPPKTEYFKEFDLVYYLGAERGFISIDSEWLVLKLGPDGQVKRASIARD